MKFRLLRGGHYSRVSKHLSKAGEIISSGRRLDLSFPGKFEMIDGGQDEAINPAYTGKVPSPGAVTNDPVEGYPGFIQQGKEGEDRWWIIDSETGKRVSPKKVTEDEISPLIEEYLERIEAKSRGAQEG